MNRWVQLRHEASRLIALAFPGLTTKELRSHIVQWERLERVIWERDVKRMTVWERDYRHVLGRLVSRRLEMARGEIERRLKERQRECRVKNHSA